jgi:hypothetical protein
MTPNHSLALTLQLKELMRTDLLHKISEDFPYDLIENQSPTKNAKVRRDRVYNEENTLLTMLVTAIHDDKSLKQSVNIFKGVFELKGKQIKDKEALQLQLAYAEKQRRITVGEPPKPGRPKLYTSRLPKSKVTEVSDNTAAYSKARERLDKDLVHKVFDYSSDFKEFNGKKWHGMDILITDGTYFQMQDTKELREKYFVKENDDAYPQGLLQAILRQGSGQVHAFRIGTRHQSELELVKPLIEKLPKNSLLLADDLYSTYAIFCLMKNKRCHLIVPGKRERNYTVIKKIAEGDEIVELHKTGKPVWLSKKEWEQIPDTIQMRRISYPSPTEEQKEYVLYSTILDQKITNIEIILKYTTRWDIEITIREIKTIMGINIARSKTDDMVDKEITIALTSYNMIRKIIAKSVEQTDFPPKKDIFYECFEIDKKLLVDKKGRIYHHWSPGRYGPANEPN